MDFGDYVTDIDIEQLDRPPKELVYPFALALLGLVIFLQLGRRRRQLDTGAPAAGVAQ